MLKHWKKIVCTGFMLAGLQGMVAAQEGNVYIYNTKNQQNTEKPAEPVGPPISRTLTIRPTGFIKSNFMVGFQQQVAPKKSLQLFGGVTAADYSDFYFAQDVLGFNGEAQFRFYLQNNKSGLSGLYAGPYAFYKSIDMEVEDWSTQGPNWEPGFRPFNGSSGGGGVLIGYQLVIKNVGIIDLFTGGGIRVSESNIDKRQGDFLDNSLNEYRSSGIYPNIGLQIGMGF